MTKLLTRLSNDGLKVSEKQAKEALSDLGLTADLNDTDYELLFDVLSSSGSKQLTGQGFAPAPTKKQVKKEVPAIEPVIDEPAGELAVSEVEAEIVEYQENVEIIREAAQAEKEAMREEENFLTEIEASAAGAERAVRFIEQEQEAYRQVISGYQDARIQGFEESMEAIEDAKSRLADSIERRKKQSAAFRQKTSDRMSDIRAKYGRKKK